MREPYHYTEQKEDGLWDCVSETIPDGTESKKLEKKDIFDWCVKHSFENGAPYMGALSSDKRTYGFYLPRWGRTYDRYFSTGMKLEDDLSDSIKARFVPEQSGKNTSGNEFSSGKFYSVASSSRFAVASFTERKDGKLDYIERIKIDGNEQDVKEPKFEHDTPVEGIGKNSRSPQLDFFFKTAHGTYFIEAKNHEIMDSHRLIELRFSYKDIDAFKRLGLIGDPCKREYVDSKGKVQQYISLIKDDDAKKHFLQAKDFGCELDTFHFDFKQFLCHLMGIWSYAPKHPEEDIYFYYLIYRNKWYEENYDKKLYEDLEIEVKSVFDVFRRRFPNIHFGLCYNDKYDTLKELKTENV